MNSSIFIKSAMALMISALVFSGSAIAQEPGTQERQAQDQNPTRAGKLDGKTQGTNIRVSKLIGMNIENSAGEGVGEINDIVLDAGNGRIRYVAVTYGGFLGIGNDMHAVPFEALRFKQNPDDRSETVLLLNVTQDQMKGSQGFNEKSWPNFADKSFTDKIDKRYGVERTHTGYGDDRNPSPDRNEKDD